MFQILLNLLSQNKNLVIFIGREEIGKSTTINSLLGVKFQCNENNDRILEPVKGSKPQAPMGSDERIGLMCTVFPAVYKDPQEDIYYLDTQGFFGSNKDPDEVAAASILLDAAIKSAASIRIVFLEDFQQFSKGLNAITGTVNILNKVILTDDAPMYCLFNRYLPSEASASRYYRSTEEQRNVIINKELQNITKKLLTTAQLNTDMLAQKLQQMTQTSQIQQPISEESQINLSDEIKERITNKEDITILMSEFNSVRIAHVINSNFQEGRYGYIDPKSDFSVNNLRNAIMNLPFVEKDVFSFNFCDEKRENFARNFEEILRDQISPLIRDICFALKYPQNLIQNIIEEQQKELDLNQSLLTNVNNCIEVDLDEIEQELKNRKTELKNSILELEQNGNKIDQEIDRIINDDLIEVRYRIINPIFTIVKYDYHIPFVGIKESYSNCILRHPSNFDANKFNVTKVFDQNNIVMHYDLKNKGNPLYEYEVLYSNIYTISNFFVRSLFQTKNFASTNFGNVTFYVRNQDYEKETLNELQKDKLNNKRLLLARQDDLKKIEKKIAENTKEILSGNIDDIQNGLSKLNDILNFVQRITEKWNARNEEDEIFTTVRDQFSAYNEISKMLYPSSVHNESVRHFMNLFDRLDNITTETDNISFIQLINSYNSIITFE